MLVRDRETYQRKSLMIMPFSSSERGEESEGGRLADAFLSFKLN